MAPDGLAARFTETASRYPSRIALSTSSGQVTYGELLADARRVARALAATASTHLPRSRCHERGRASPRFSARFSPALPMHRSMPRIRRTPAALHAR